MHQISDLLKKYELVPNRYDKLGKAIIINTREGKYVVKEKTDNDILKYLNSRSFNYYPNIVGEDYDYEIEEYINQVNMPDEQKMMDMIDLVTLLHNKTTYYKEVDEDEYKKIYEDILNNIEHLNSYYNDMIASIETKVYMSPSEYLLARNISKVFSTLNYCKYELENWYSLVKEKRKIRYVVLHNNLDLSHFIKDKKSYLISWNKSKIDIPIFDVYKLYKKYCLDYDFEDIFKRYESNYQLLKEEKILLFILISLPDKIIFDNNEYEITKKISKMIDTIYKTDKFISNENTKTKNENSKNK